MANSEPKHPLKTTIEKVHHKRRENQNEMRQKICGVILRRFWKRDVPTKEKE